jgi:hypothetical protein
LPAARGAPGAHDACERDGARQGGAGRYGF